MGRRSDYSIRNETMKIYLLRHGESVDDIEDSYGGIADYPLTEAGRQTADDLARKLVGAGIELLYSSPYKRAIETASIVSSALRCEVKTIDDLRERNSYGVLSAINKAKAKEIFAHVLRDLKQKPGDYYSEELVCGAEPRAEFDARVKKAFEEVLKESVQYKVIGIVTHGNVTRSIYRNILAVSGKIELDLLATTIINYAPASMEIVAKEGITVKQG